MSLSKMLEFKEKLISLMKEYNIQIGFDCGPGSDTYGLYGECICFQSKDEEIKIDGYWVGAGDIEDSKIRGIKKYDKEET
jgi:hypothetical protein